MDKEYSLIIGVSKLKELKKNKGGIVSHHASVRWKDFCKKRRKKVRFFDTVFHEECIFTVISVEQIYQLREHRVRIKVKL